SSNAIDLRYQVHRFLPCDQIPVTIHQRSVTTHYALLATRYSLLIHQLQRPRRLCRSYLHIGHQFRHDRLLHVQAVLGFLKDDGTWGIDDIIGDFISAMCRQAMHENGIALGAAEKRAVHLIGQEYFAALLGLGLLSHTGPHIGVDNVSLRCRLPGIVSYDASPTSFLTTFLGPDQRIGLWFVTGRSCDPDIRTQLRSGKHQRVGHIVAVTDECEL